MPFGLTNAPSTFQAAMNQLFSSYLCKFVIVFFDDILIYSSFMIAHLEHLDLVLHHLYSHQFYVKLSKCLFCKGSIQYLGHIIYSAGVHANSKKIEAMVQGPISKTVKQLRGFLGLIGYYRRFIVGYATIVAPLTDLLRKDSFKWTSTANSAFETLKQAMVATPVMHLPDFTQEFVIETMLLMRALALF